MSFSLRPYTPPDFTQPFLADAPDVCFQPTPFDGVAPEQYHAMSIFPEYFKVNGTWLLAEESRMDCVAVYENGKIIVREFRLLKKGDLIAIGRTEDGLRAFMSMLTAFPKKGITGSFCFPSGTFPGNSLFQRL